MGSVRPARGRFHRDQHAILFNPFLHHYLGLYHASATQVRADGLSLRQIARNACISYGTDAIIRGTGALFYGAKMIRDAEQQESRQQLAEVVVRMKAKRIRRPGKRSRSKALPRVFGHH